MDIPVINFLDKFSKIEDHWAPKIIAALNNYHLKLAKVYGDFIWHNHIDTDEVFIVIEGELRIDFRDSSLTVKSGEMVVVPKGVDHKPYAEKECKILLVEPAGIINTGSTLGKYTVLKDEWI